MCGDLWLDFRFVERSLRKLMKSRESGEASRLLKSYVGRLES
jgi:hypothetical protein